MGVFEKNAENYTAYPQISFITTLLNYEQVITIMTMTYKKLWQFGLYDKNIINDT